MRSAQGKEIMRNWLACGAPVVAATQDTCTALPELGTVGACRAADQGDPSAADVYTQIIVGGRCVQGCHEPGGFEFNDHQLDLSLPEGAPEAAYDAVFDVPTKGQNCGGTDMLTGEPNRIIVPFDCQSSVLFQKLNATSAFQVCGAPMPLGRTDPFPQAQLDLLCAWIDAGAPASLASGSTCGP